MRALAPALAVFLALAGCLGAGVEPVAEAAPLERVSHFTSAMTLAEAPEPESSAVGSGSFYLAWQAGEDYPTWLAPPEPVDILVENITVALRVRATGPVAESPPFPDIMVYGGSGGSWIAFGTAVLPPVLAPGERQALDVQVLPPGGGLRVPAGESFGLKVVPVMQQNDAADLQVEVGGEDGTRVAWRVRPVAPVDVTLTSDAVEGATRGSAYAGAAAPPETRHVTPIPLETAPSLLLAWMNVTSHTGVPDLDLALLGPEGDEVAFSGTPTPREFLRLGPENLHGPGEYQLVVTSYGSAEATFRVEWQVG